MSPKFVEIVRGLWCDETGAVVSAEAALVATLGVVGASVGMDTLAKSINEELIDVAFAVRSFDQSFSVKQRRSEGAQVARSRFQQTDVKMSHAELREYQREVEARQQKQLKKLKRDRDDDRNE